jgi:hypothetical protein
MTHEAVRGVELQTANLNRLTIYPTGGAKMLIEQLRKHGGDNNLNGALTFNRNRLVTDRNPFKVIYADQGSHETIAQALLTEEGEDAYPQITDLIGFSLAISEKDMQGNVHIEKVIISPYYIRDRKLVQRSTLFLNQEPASMQTEMIQQIFDSIPWEYFGGRKLIPLELETQDGVTRNSAYTLDERKVVEVNEDMWTALRR